MSYAGFLAPGGVLGSIMAIAHALAATEAWETHYWFPLAGEGSLVEMLRQRLVFAVGHR